MPLSELKSKYRKVSSLEKAQTGWEEEYEASSKQVYFFRMYFFVCKFAMKPNIIEILRLGQVLLVAF